MDSRHTLDYDTNKPNNLNAMNACTHTRTRRARATHATQTRHAMDTPKAWFIPNILPLNHDHTAPPTYRSAASSSALAYNASSFLGLGHSLEKWPRMP